MPFSHSCDVRIFAFGVKAKKTRQRDARKERKYRVWCESSQNRIEVQKDKARTNGFKNTYKTL